MVGRQDRLIDARPQVHSEGTVTVRALNSPIALVMVHAVEPHVHALDANTVSIPDHAVNLDAALGSGPARGATRHERKSDRRHPKCLETGKRKCVIANDPQQGYSSV
jgi:hypothetical protein